tara:strand:- start:20 stop:889 length:870 start_codon:yes stop_codon:yes gene_type:complete
MPSRKLKKYKQKTKKFCSPSNNSYKFSCFNKKSLIKIVRAWNKKNSNKKISIKGKSSQYLWKQLDKRLKKICKDELCWTKQKFVKDIKDKNIKNSFKPKKPKSWNSNKFEWLSTYDIERVIKQYEEKYPNFIFIGAVPIDFDESDGVGQCIVNELCKLDLKKMILEKIFQIGIVFNMDKHDEDGSHWVSMFIDLKKDGIYYFDSYGTNEPNEIKNLSERLLEQAKQLGKMNMKYKVNQHRHQYRNSECGVYCINFIVNMLKGHSFDKYTKKVIKDLEMNKKREFYFSPN